ncbi:MAG: hypothetical protein ABSE87_04805 [Terracidiphilus sp.]
MHSTVIDQALPVSKASTIKLHNLMGIGTLEGVKRWRSIVVAGLVIAGVVYVYLHRQELGLVVPHDPLSAVSPDSGGSTSASDRPARITWQTVDRPKDGFTIEMPRDIREIQLPAYSESGTPGTINMIYANPDPTTTFSLSWSDNPPVMQVNNRAPDRTLDMARDEALARTQTTPVSEARTNPGGFPARDFVARNAGGGMMDTRLICVGNRLYMLTAAFPSMGARREQDVTRFYNSFRASAPSDIPEALPAASGPKSN